ncbi:MAG TPA: hypothetical protein VLC98_10400 [Phnomibacter sp.]|nr:hypothetical protein [Phnomibacter sp.]
MKNEIIIIAFDACWRSVVCYAIITLPALFFPLMYGLSLMYAILWSMPAVLLFMLALWLCKMAELPLALRYWLLQFMALVIVFAATYGAAWHYSGGKEVMKDYIDFFLFPLAAMVATMLVLLVRRKQMEEWLSEKPESFIQHTKTTIS